MTFDRAYFETQYCDYERQNPNRKISFYQRLTERAAAGCVRPRILDIGCAFGLFLSALGDRWERFGVDASEYAIQRAKERAPDICFALSRQGEIPFPGPYDVVTAFDVLEHITAFEILIAWVAANLRPGGGLIFVVPVYDGLTGPVIRLLDKDPSHVHREGRNFWLRCAQADFQLVDWWGIYRYLLPGGGYLHVVTHALRRFTPAIACLLRRRQE